MDNTREEIDEISFHMLMKSCRRKAGASLELLGRGLYTSSMMARVERGEMIPNYVIRNRIMARLGNSSDGYEDFLQPSEYKKYLECLDLIDNIETGNKLEARCMAVNMLAEDEECNSVKRQFLYDMIARSYINYDIKKTREYYKKACSCTIKLEEVSQGNYGLLAPEEFYLLLRLLYYDFICENDKREKTTSFYEKCFEILEHIENSAFDDLGKAKVYPFGVVILCRIVSKMDYRCDVYRITNKIDNAFRYLKSKARFYFFEELANEIVHMQKRAIFWGAALDKYDKYISLAEMYQNICKDLNNTINMDYDCFIYRNSDVYCISDVIKKRRKMLGISREELAMVSNCSVRTIMRIENGKVDSQREVIRCIFGKLNIDSEYRRSVVLTNDKEIMDEYFRYAHASFNSSNMELLKESTYKLIDKMDLRYVTNQQIRCMMINYYLSKQNNISKSILAEKMVEALEITIHNPLNSLKDGYLSSAELMLLIGIMKSTEKISDKERVANYLYRYITEHAYQGNLFNIAALENVAVWLADEYSDKNMLSETHEVSKKLLLTEIQSHRILVLHAALFLYVRNQAKREELDVNEIYKILDFCMLLCEFAENKRYREYYQKVKEIVNKKGDWVSY